MKLVGSSNLRQSTTSQREVSLTDSTNALAYWKTSFQITKEARSKALLSYLDGTRQLMSKSSKSSPEDFFKNYLDKESLQRESQDIKLWKEHTANDPLLGESLKIQNNPDDLSPLPQGKPKSPQEALTWRGEVPVSKQAVMQYFTTRTSTSLEGPDHPGSRALVREFLPEKYFSVYSEDLSPEKLALALAAKPLDSQSLEYLIIQEARNNSANIRFELGDNLATIKGKIVDISDAEKKYLELDALHNKSTTECDELNGKLEAFVLLYLPVASSICPEAIRDKLWPQVWNAVHSYFIDMAKHMPSKAVDQSFPHYDSQTDNIASYKSKLGTHLAQIQLVSQEAHASSRGLSKLNYESAVTDTICLSDEEWNLKDSPATWAPKETKDATIRDKMREAFSEDQVFSNRITIEERANGDVTASQLFKALENEERLNPNRLKALAINDNVKVNSVNSSIDNELKMCELHNRGGHDTADCKMLNNGTVLYDHATKTYVYKDTGALYQQGKGNHSDKAHADGPKSKKSKTSKSHDKGGGKKDIKKSGKDKKKEDKKKENRKTQKVNTAIDGLKTTFVNLIQSSSSSTASAPAAAIQASAPQDAILVSINKQFSDLKKSLGLPEP